MSTTPNTAGKIVSPMHPYADRYEVHSTMPEQGVSRDEILRELREMSTEEDAKGDSGRVSGSIYSGDHDHYAFLVEAYAFYAHSERAAATCTPAQRRWRPRSSR